MTRGIRINGQVPYRLVESFNDKGRNIPISFLIRRSLRYLLVLYGFRVIQSVAVLAVLIFMLTGSRIIAINRYSNRADIVASILVTLATITLLAGLNRRVMTAVDRRFFHEAYNAVVEAKRIERDLELAAEVQRHLFPAGGLEDDDLEIYGTYLPALGVGGDYYDYFHLDERRTGIAIADVAGKGIAAALLMSTVQASLRCQLIPGDRPLADVVSSINSLLQRSTGDGGYATFFLAEFDNRTQGLTYVNAGHNPPMLVRGRRDSQEEDGGTIHLPDAPRDLSDKEYRASSGSAAPVLEQPTVGLLTKGGPIIGSFLNGPYEQETIQVRSGDILVAYTDGVTEALNPAGVEFGEERLRLLLVESPRLSARDLAEKLTVKVLEWQGHAPQHDDITLIVVKVK
jgi:sigma-B regulation protein RsbU (phosphoserine phosphatase)